MSTAVKDRKSPSGSVTAYQIRRLYTDGADPVPAGGNTLVLLNAAPFSVKNFKLGATVKVTANLGSFLPTLVFSGSVVSADPPGVAVLIQNVSGGDVARPVDGWDLTVEVSN